MNKKTIFLLLIFLTFFSCNNQNTNACDYLKKGDVCIVIKNRSGNNIKTLAVIHERGKSEMSNISDRENASVSFNSPGESSYKIRVVFENGKMIESKDAYIEGGYKMTQEIKANSIESENYDSY